LNDPLRKQILYHLHADLFHQITQGKFKGKYKVEFFKECSSVEQCFFICNLKPVLFLPKDYIIREGERGDNLYFINKGEAVVTLRDSKSKQ
jgi:hypothetical protein